MNKFTSYLMPLWITFISLGNSAIYRWIPQRIIICHWNLFPWWCCGIAIAPINRKKSNRIVQHHTHAIPPRKIKVRSIWNQKRTKSISTCIPWGERECVCVCRRILSLNRCLNQIDLNRTQKILSKSLSFSQNNRCASKFPHTNFAVVNHLPPHHQLSVLPLTAHFSCGYVLSSCT